MGYYRCKIDIINIISVYILIIFILASINPDIAVSNDSSVNLYEPPDQEVDYIEKQYETNEYTTVGIGNTRGTDVTSRGQSLNYLEYVVIGNESFRGAAEPLIEWKTQKGVPALYKSFQSIYSEYSSAGGDELYKIREYLKASKTAHPELKWVLIMGDSDEVPPRMLYAGAEDFGMNQFYDSDHYLGALNGSWDSDSDGIYGEQKEDEDWDSELFVGRLPVGSPEEVSLVVQKILSYERSPPDGDWFKRALIMGSLMDAPNVADDPDTMPPHDEGYNEYKDNAYEVKKKSLDLFPSNFEFTELYDYDRMPGGEYSIETDTLTQAAAVQEFNRGYSLINFAGQARFNGNSLMQYESEGGTGNYSYHRYFAWKDLYHYEDAEKASNGGMLPLMMMPTCDAANFVETDDTNLEKLFTAKNGGIIGLISSTGPSHRGESIDGNSYGNWWEDEQFWKIFFRDDFYRPGEALAELKSSFAANILDADKTHTKTFRKALKGNLEGLTLLGDPEVPIWTDIPRSSNVNVKNLTTGVVNIEIFVSDAESNEPIQGALVALSNQDTYLYGETDVTGSIVFHTQIESPGKINITVTAHNYLPIENVNDIPYARPQIKPIEDIIINEDENLKDHLKLRDIIQDADTPFDDLVIELDVENTNVGVSIDSEYVMEIIPDRDWFGSSRVSLIVKDGIYSEYMNFTIIVLSVNDPPDLTGIPVTLQAKEDQLFTYSKIGATDPDSPDLKFYDDTDLFDIDESTGRISFIPTQTHVGKHNVCIFVTDGHSIKSGCFNITISEMPDAPVISPISMQEIDADEQFEYKLLVYDDDSDKLSYSINPDWLKIDPATGMITSTPGTDKVGEHKVTVQVSDDNSTSTETFTLVVHSNVDYQLITMIVGYVALGLLLVLGFVFKRYKMIKAESIYKSEKSSPAGAPGDSIDRNRSKPKAVRSKKGSRTLKKKL
jgi:hypothetical protein